MPTMSVTLGRPGTAHEPRGRPRAEARWPDGVVALGLLVAAALWFHWLAAGASTSGVITGEEASISHRDALSVALRWQPSIWSTNFGSQVFYWAAGHLTPHYGLLYGRAAKALAMALLPALVYLVARRRLACGRPAALVGGVAVALLPGVSTVAWVATENGLEAVWGVAALLVTTSARRWWPAGLVLAGVAVSNYTAGLAWAGVVALVALVRVVGGWRARGPRAVTGPLVGLAVGLAVVFAPLLWWRNGGIVVTGGGYAGASLADVPTRLAEVVRYAAVDGSSYYYFSSAPLLGGTVAAVVLLLAAVVATAARPAAAWPWATVAPAAVGLYAIASGAPGSRRLVALAVVAALLAAVALDVVVAALPRRLTRPAGLGAAALALIALSVATVPPTLTWRDEVVSGTRALPIDWPFPVDPGGTQASTFARLDADLRTGRLTAAEVADGWGGTRTLAVIYMLAVRTGAPPALAPADVLAAYRASSDCRDLDGTGPACP